MERMSGLGFVGSTDGCYITHRVARKSLITNPTRDRQFNTQLEARLQTQNQETQIQAARDHSRDKSGELA